MTQYAEVLVDVANRRLDRSYHYVIPEKLEIKIGMTVLVPLRNRKVQGLVLKVSEEIPDIGEGIRLLPVEKILDCRNLVPQELLELAAWLAETTICPVAQALHSIWPFLKGKAEPWFIPLAKPDDEDVKALKFLDPETFNVLTVLHRSRSKGLTEKVLLRRTGAGQHLLEEMIQQGWLKKETKYTGKGSTRAAGKKQSGPDASRRDSKVILNPGQKKAIEYIWNFYQKKDGGTVLLRGITGSGKTEIYRKIVERVLEEGGDAIVLVPEISLTSQIAEIFLEQFGSLVGVIHSGIKAAAKLGLWEQIYSGEKRVIIGARSAVFAPLPNLSLIVLDEEHDNAYKQDENPKYHARDVARYRMVQRQGLVLLGSATPSLEAYAASRRGKIGLVTLEERVNRKALPLVRIVDMRLELASGNRSMFSQALAGKLRERIKRGEQSILFLNRRGYSTFVFCRECGFVARCPYCDISLTYHSQKQGLCCHYCSFQQEVFHLCPECGSRFIRFFGQGTQKVEEEVSALLPGTEVLRLDTDSTREANTHRDILEKFRRQEASILVGTQMLAKGLDFPNVTLVGVISADQLLNMPDFRSRERAYQLLTQVAGRAGRGDKKGEVIIQTYSPRDPAIIQAAKQEYPAFFREELAYRKKLGYPPFSHIIRLLLYHEQEERIIRAAHVLADGIRLQTELEKDRDYQVLGPAPAVLTKLKNEYRWQVSIKGRDPAVLRKIVHSGVKSFYQNPASSGINLNIEMNPLSG